MPLSPYISFAGNCADAIVYHQKALGAELFYKINFGETPKSAQNGEDGCPSGTKFPDTVIVHTNLRIAGSNIMMNDSAPDGNAHCSGFTLVLDVQNIDKGKRRFDNLAANGKTETDWQEAFWIHDLNKVSDQYGVPQMINVVKQQ